MRYGTPSTIAQEVGKNSCVSASAWSYSCAVIRRGGPKLAEKRGGFVTLDGAAGAVKNLPLRFDFQRLRYGQGAQPRDIQKYENHMKII